MRQRPIFHARNTHVLSTVSNVHCAHAPPSLVIAKTGPSTGDTHPSSTRYFRSPLRRRRVKTPARYTPRVSTIHTLLFSKLAGITLRATLSASEVTGSKGMGFFCLNFREVAKSACPVLKRYTAGPMLGFSSKLFPTGMNVNGLRPP